jgi:hypothetical protein
MPTSSAMAIAASKAPEYVLGASSTTSSLIRYPFFSQPNAGYRGLLPVERFLFSKIQIGSRWEAAAHDGHPPRELSRENSGVTKVYATGRGR